MGKGTVTLDCEKPQFLNLVGSEVSFFKRSIRDDFPAPSSPKTQILYGGFVRGHIIDKMFWKALFAFVCAFTFLVHSLIPAM